ncbi:hypothetical protein C8Q79DRAFT_1011661 [Trametes meyenii]|nr:hypothetical protein C8Q79DRAFT_1011661 [Trametes meyenii]
MPSRAAQSSSRDIRERPSGRAAAPPRNSNLPSTNAQATATDALTPEELSELLADPEADSDALGGRSAAAQKQYKAVVADLQSAKKANWAVRDHSPLEMLRNVARMTMWMHGPYLSVSTAVTTGLLACAAPTVEEGVERCLALREIEPQFRERYLKVGQWLVANVPYLSMILPMLEEDPSTLMLVGRFVDYHARAARTADISTLKQQLPQWVANVELQLPERDTQIIISPRVNGIFDKNKANYGWNSLWTSRLLMWRIFRDAFDNDPKKCQAELRAGLRMTHHYFPSFVYLETDEPVEDEEDCLPFLLTGDLLTKIHPDDHHHFVQLCHIFSSETTWAMQDPKAFNGAQFWVKIVELLKNDETLAERVFKHFHYYVYGGAPDPRDHTGDGLVELEAVKRAFARARA